MHGTSCTEGVCADGISTIICSKVYEIGNLMEVDELTICETFLISELNGIFTVLGGYKCSVIKNRSLLTTNSDLNRNNKNLDIQVENR